jgi:predicted Fe-Mo cluster-binding NifX family protein
MKIAVSALDRSLSSAVDERFGRARYLLIVDTVTDKVTVIDNVANANALQGSGIGAAEIVAEHQVQAVITGHLGPKAMKALQAAGVRGYRGVGMTAGDAVSAFEAGMLGKLEDEAPAHSGL